MAIDNKMPAKSKLDSLDTIKKDVKGDSVHMGKSSL